MFSRIAALALLAATGANAASINVSSDITGATTWYATNTYVLRTVVSVQSNAVLIAGAVVAVLVFAVRSLSKDRFLRGDLRGALIWFALFFSTRVAAALADGLLSAQGNRVLRVVWMSAAAFDGAATRQLAHGPLMARHRWQMAWARTPSSKRRSCSRHCRPNPQRSSRAS